MKRAFVMSLLIGAVSPTVSDADHGAPAVATQRLDRVQATELLFDAEAQVRSSPRVTYRYQVAPRCREGVYADQGCDITIAERGRWSLPGRYLRTTILGEAAMTYTRRGSRLWRGEGRPWHHGYCSEPEGRTRSSRTRQVNDKSADLMRRVINTADDDTADRIIWQRGPRTSKLVWSGDHLRLAVSFDAHRRPLGVRHTVGSLGSDTNKLRIDFGYPRRLAVSVGPACRR